PCYYLYASCFSIFRLHSLSRVCSTLRATTVTKSLRGNRALAEYLRRSLDTADGSGSSPPFRFPLPWSPCACFRQLTGNSTARLRSRLSTGGRNPRDVGRRSVFIAPPPSLGAAPGSTARACFMHNDPVMKDALPVICLARHGQTA